MKTIFTIRTNGKTSQFVISQGDQIITLEENYGVRLADMILDNEEGEVSLARLE